jgi:RTX calcium-binding nonapeptide repeat (4 copies)
MSVNNTADSEVPVSGVGLTNPSLSFGLSGVSDWSNAMPFVDLAHTMRSWIGHEGGTWEAMTYSQLRAGGYLDENGWVKQIPEELDAVGTVWDGQGVEPGIYVLTYEGEGSIDITLGPKVLSSEPGRIVFENTGGEMMGFNINVTDPNGTGNYIRNISVVNEKYEGLVQTGELFNPDWLSVIEDARQLRFMDWMATNNTTWSEWDDRPQVEDMTWAINGVPIEVMVELANQTGTEPWFTMPTHATDEYIREFATYVRDHLNPDLKAHVEYSNETWNWAFQQTGWLNSQANEVWGNTEGSAWLNFAAKRATETALIWDDVFGDQSDARVDNVLGVQTVNPWLAEHELTAPIWAAEEPDNYVAPYTVFDSLAVTTYFGVSTVSHADMRAELIAAINDPDVDAAAWLAAKLNDPTYDQSIPQIKSAWVNMNEIADKYGLDLVAYEGGQHVHHSFAIDGLSETDVTTLTDFFVDFVRSPEMADLYEQLWDAWAEVSDGPFMQFGDVGAPSKWGSWALLKDLGDTNPRAGLLFENNAENEAWFGDGGGEQYQQGVITIAGDDGELLTGTQKTDFLIGGAGDDIFIPGTGHDGINGDAGNDTVVLAGNPQDYFLVQEGNGYRLTGTNTSHFIINVENFKFDGDVTLPLKQIPSS